MTPLYIRSVLCYGLARSAYVLSNAEIDYFNYNTKKFETRSLLFTERFGGLVFGTLITASCAPMFLARDIHAFELYTRGRYEIEKKKQSNASVMGHTFDSFF